MDSTGNEGNISPGAQRLIRYAVEQHREQEGGGIDLRHWLLALLSRHSMMAESMVRGLDSTVKKRELYAQIGEGNVGPTLDKDSMLRKAMERAKSHQRNRITEQDLAAVILSESGFELNQESSSQESSSPPPIVTMDSPGKSDKTCKSGESFPAIDRISANTYKPRSLHATVTLDQYGRDLTKDAVAGKLIPVTGRDQEIQLLIETLCRKTKRNPVLVGDAGVGKTAIVEGFAQYMVKGDVPKSLKDARVISVQPSSLSAGASYAGEFEKRMKALLDEASQDGIILFIDEVHSIIGTGGAKGSSDFASLLKPALARGDMACIAATTSEEYRRYIEPDAALERRFQPISVTELSPQATLGILANLRDELEKLRCVRVSDEGLRWLVDFADSFLRNRNFPDKGVDLLEQCVAYGEMQGKAELGITEVQEVAQRMVGMPLDPDARLAALRKRISEGSLLDEASAGKLIDRLSVTMKGLDLRHLRPNAILLLCGDAAAQSYRLSETIAETCFGFSDRVVTIDFSRFTEPEHVTMLLGAPPAYVGYDAPVPLHKALQTPWFVLNCENVHECHPHFIDILAQAFSDGYFTDAKGKRIHISDTVVILTAESISESRRPLGFLQAQDEPSVDLRKKARARFGSGFIDQMDMICETVPLAGDKGEKWVEQNLLAHLTDRFRRQGVRLVWEESVARWILSQQVQPANPLELERVVDDHLSPALVRSINAFDHSSRNEILVRCIEGQIRVQPIPKGGKNDDRGF